MKVILASKSPRRRELLKLVVDEFDVIESNVEEKVDEKLSPEKTAEEISYLKAKAVYDKTNGDRVIIASDTIVVKNRKIYGKPTDKQDARNKIKELLEGDRTHYVITGLTVMVNKNGEYKEYKTFEKSKVYFKEISDEEIQKWIDTGKAMDKAGAYAIQEEFAVHIEKVEGDYFSIIGLPIKIIYDILKKIS